MKLGDWLQECGIQTVAMESTGVYWIPLMQIPESRGLDVYLVNGTQKTFLGENLGETV
jgi:transposase